MRRLSAAVVAVLLFPFSCSNFAAAQEPSPTPLVDAKKTPSPSSAQDSAAVPATPATPHALEAGDLGAFFDGILPLQLERADIAGASVLVMRNGEPLLLKGYGYADAKEKKPVDPRATMFRLASISKLFTWVSVMQLAEQGRLDLDTDVNQYLDFPIRPAFGKPITLRNLMTHTAGFEEETRDIILIKPKQKPTLREFLIANQPRRMFPPGIIPAYSNYGVGLGSYVVERVSGQPFEKYVAEHIFAPLGMTHSTFEQPPQEALAKFPSEGYRGNSTQPAVGFEIFNPPGAGGVSSSAYDMGRFGQALLNGGELDGQRILKAETLQQMWTPQFRANDQMPPICMGFYQVWRNDLRWIGHEGDLIAFHSLFMLEPSQRLILFVSFNSAGSAGKTRPELVNMFSDRYFPKDVKQTFIKMSDGELKSVTGTYQSTRRADSTKLKLDSLFSQREAKINKDGALVIEDIKDLRGHTIQWKPIAKDLFQEVDGQRKIFAIRDGDGKVLRLAYDFAGVQAQRVRWADNAKLNTVLLCLALFILACVVLATLSRAFRRIFLKRRPAPAPQPGTEWVPIGSKLSAWLWVGVLGAIFGVLAALGDDVPPPTREWDKYFYLVNVAAVLCILFSVFPVFSGIRAWFRSELRTISKVKFSLVGAAALFLCWFAVHWNLLGPATRF